MNKIIISENAWYPGRTMNWTEERTGTRKLQKGQMITHFSHEEIKAFVPKITCFFIGFPCIEDLKDKELDYDRQEHFAEEYIYIAIVKKDISALEYGNEVRIDLKKHKDDIDIYLVGEHYNIDGSKVRAYNLDKDFLTLIGM
ncbi:hypothetical protein [Vallitalea guaymasensis]|uniref:hypothetical protein n=1 Tax=Vallitalea guaymasensis TaxID=1185412 RepID=UPI000DE232B7|nr:hypothetical protein [Vallitalea guaymasensis]